MKSGRERLEDPCANVPAKQHEEELPLPSRWTLTLTQIVTMHSEKASALQSSQELGRPSGTLIICRVRTF
jgi:hypothetical protein